MQSIILLDELTITIYKRSKANSISATDWDILSGSCSIKNPFYERWNLLPALNHLELEEVVLITTVYNKKELVALFPIKIEKSIFSILYLTLWMHDHCYYCTPLFKGELNFNVILSKLGEVLKTSFSIISLHSSELFHTENKNLPNNIHTSITYRAAITNSTNIKQNLSILNGKFRRDLKRNERQLRQLGNLEFRTQQDLSLGLENYCRIEHKGWKGRARGSISSLESTKSYYLSLISTLNAHNKIQCFELVLNNQCIASSIRFISSNNIYEVKTSYDEGYKRYSPGKLLEIQLLNQLSHESFELVDSCTQPDNTLINRLWPDQVTLHTSYLFYPNIFSYTLQILHKIKGQAQLLKKLFKDFTNVNS